MAKDGVMNVVTDIVKILEEEVVVSIHRILNNKSRKCHN